MSDAIYRASVLFMLAAGVFLLGVIAIAVNAVGGYFITALASALMLAAFAGMAAAVYFLVVALGGRHR